MVKDVPNQRSTSQVQACKATDPSGVMLEERVEAQPACLQETAVEQDRTGLAAFLGPVDAFALPADDSPAKFYDSVVELRYAAQDSDEEPAAKRQRAEQQPSSAAAAAQPAQQCFRVAASAMLLARASEKFERALHPDWSGSSKVLVLDIEEGQVDVYRHLLHNLHMIGMPKPWLPDGVSDLAALLEVASSEMVTLTLRDCAKALAAKAADLSQGEAAMVVAAAIHSETDAEEGKLALATLRQVALDRLVALSSPLEQFWTRPRSGMPLFLYTGPVLLPSELLKLVLESDSLEVESEETVLATALAWLQRHASKLCAEVRRERTVQLLSCVRWGLLQPNLAACAWHCSDLIRTFDPHRQLVCFLLLGKQLPETSVWWSRLKEQHPHKWWQQRCGGPIAVSFDTTFHIQAQTTGEFILGYSDTLFKRGFILRLCLMKPDGDSPVLRFFLDFSLKHLGGADGAASPTDGMPSSLVPSALPLPFSWSGSVESSDGAQRVPLPACTDAVAVPLSNRDAMFRFFSPWVPLSLFGRDREGQPFTAANLMGPHSPFMRPEGFLVHAKLSFT